MSRKRNLSQTTIVAILVTASLFIKDDPIPEHTSILTGNLYYQETMENPNENNFRNCCRMSKHVFNLLLDLLQVNGKLVGSRLLSAGEKLMVFIHIIVGHSMRQTAHRFQHSTSTINAVLVQVKFAILNSKSAFLRIPNFDDPIHPSIRLNPKFFPFFSDCIGALDGTHVHACVNPELQDSFRNRKGYTSQNVLGVVNFDMIFSYILAGWEGSAHDGRVLESALSKGLTIFPGKYYLGDAGYALTPYCLTPYRGVRYHLKEWASGNKRPQNPQELFNLRHSSLRNVIERTFGVVKKRFPLLVLMYSYPISTQVDLVLCIFYLHNFIRIHQYERDEFDNFDENDEDRDVNIRNIDVDDSDMSTFRDTMAQNMWNQYIEYLSHR